MGIAADASTCRVIVSRFLLGIRREAGYHILGSQAAKWHCHEFSFDLIEGAGATPSNSEHLLPLIG